MNQPSLLPEAQKKLNSLVVAFLSENEKVNLSAIRTETDVREKHLNDSFAAREFMRSDDIKTVLDIGTGGGFPLLPLAIAFPEKSFTGLDSVGKKLAAIERIAVECAIQNVQVLNGRAEDLGQNPKYREQFDAVTARAVAKFPVLLEIASPFVKPGGIFICFRGPEFDQSDTQLAEKLNLKFIQITEYELTGGEKRSLWIFEKNGMLRKKYPRAVGIPKSKPLSLMDF